MNPIEVRGFGNLLHTFKARNWPSPLLVNLPRNGMRAADLAAMLDLPANEVEVVFVNGRVQSMECLIQEGDRVAFVPPGTPGPYRLLLGFLPNRWKAD